MTSALEDSLTDEEWRAIHAGEDATIGKQSELVVSDQMLSTLGGTGTQPVSWRSPSASESDPYASGTSTPGAKVPQAKFDPKKNLPEGWRWDAQLNRAVDPEGGQHTWNDEDAASGQGGWIRTDNLGGPESSDETTGGGSTVKLDDVDKSKVSGGMNAAEYNQQVEEQRKENARLAKGREEAKAQEDHIREQQRTASGRMAAEAERNRLKRNVTEAESYDDFFKAADEYDPDVDTRSPEYLAQLRERSRMKREAEENFRKYGSYDPSADEAVESGSMTAEDYSKLSERAGQPRAEPTMEEQQGTDVPQVQQNMPGTVQGETDPDAERRGRELAEMYDDTGMTSDQEQISETLPWQETEGQDPTGYTEETAADAFGEPTTDTEVQENMPGTVQGDDVPQENKPPEQVKEEDNKSMLDWAQDEMRAVVDSIGFDEDEYRDAQTTAAEQRLRESERRLAARFAFTPGGAQSGQAMAAWSGLEQQYNNEMAAIEDEIFTRNTAARTEKVTALQNAFTTAVTSDLDQQKIDNQMEQFNEQLVISLRELGLNETQTTAAVSKIYAEIGNEKLRTSADVAAIWAGLTGETGQPGTITAADLGIDLDDADLASAFLGGGDAGKRVAISESYFAMTGQRPSDAQINSILGGAGVEVESMPTMEARQLAAQVTSDNMERAAKYKSIAEQNGLNREQFEQGQKEYDDQWALTTGDVAGQFGLDQSKFTMANFDLEAYEAKLNLNTTLEPQVRNELLTNFKRQKAEEFKNPAAFLEAHNRFRDTVGNQRADIATKRNMDADAFANASRQADAAEARFLETWATISRVEPQQIATDRTFQGKAGEQLATRVRDSIFKPLYNIITDEFGEDIGDQKLSPEQLNTVVDNAMTNSDYINNTRTQLEIAFPGNIFTDTDIRLTIESSVLDLKDVTANQILAGATHAPEPSPTTVVSYKPSPTSAKRYSAPYGNLTPAQQSQVYAEIKARAPTKFGISKVFSTPSDWFAGLDPEAQSSIISLIGGQMQQSNQQKTKGGGFFGAVGRVAGMALGAYAGGLGSGMGETIAKKVF